MSVKKNNNNTIFEGLESDFFEHKSYHFSFLYFIRRIKHDACIQ